MKKHSLNKLDVLRVLHSAQVSLLNPLGFGIGFGGIVGVLVIQTTTLIDPLTAGTAVAGLTAAILKIQWVYEVNRIETFLLQSFDPDPELTPARLPTSLTLAYNKTVSNLPDNNLDEPPITTEDSPTRLVVVLNRERGNKTFVHFPEWLSLEQFEYFVQRICIEGQDPKDSTLCHDGVFTESKGDVVGTLTKFREWLFQQGWAESNVPGAWETVRRKGWRLKGREGRNALRGLLIHLQEQYTPLPQG